MFFLKNFLKEALRTLKDRDIIVLLLMGPIALTLYFGGAYLNNYVEDIPIAVLDEDQSSLSRMIVQQFDENDRFHLEYVVDSKETLKELFDKRKVHMALYIPYHFSKDTNTLKGSEVLILVDGTNVIIGNNAYATAANIIQTISAGTQMKVLQAKGMLPQLAKNTVLPFQWNERTLYDPRMTYMNYLMLGFIAVFLQQVMVSGVGISIIKGREELQEGKMIIKVLTKIIICTGYALISTFISIKLLNLFFKVQLQGNLLDALLLCTVFAIAISCPAILLAAILKEKVKMAQISFMLSLPTFVSCGYVWPIDQMPEKLVNGIKIFWPLINFARPFDELLFKGVPLEIFKNNILEMCIYILIWMPVGLFLLKKTFLKNTDKKNTLEG